MKSVGSHLLGKTPPKNQHFAYVWQSTQASQRHGSLGRSHFNLPSCFVAPSPLVTLLLGSFQSDKTGLAWHGLFVLGKEEVLVIT